MPDPEASRVSLLPSMRSAAQVLEEIEALRRLKAANPGDSVLIDSQIRALQWVLGIPQAA